MPNQVPAFSGFTGVRFANTWYSEEKALTGNHYLTQFAMDPTTEEQA